jgi:predicted Zn-dependent peptidase
MNRLLSAEIGTGEYLSVSEVMQRFQSVSLSQIQAVAGEVFARPSSLVAVGPKLTGLSL